MPEAARQFNADIFQALAHPTRIAIVEMLRNGELPAGKLIERLGIEQANASQHLRVLRTKYVLTSRKEGNQVLYSLRSPIIAEVLELMRRYFQQQLTRTVAALEEIDEGDER